MKDVIDQGGGSADINADTPEKSKSGDEELKDDKVFASTRWTDQERDIIFVYYLGPEADSIFKQLKSNAKYAHGKVWFLFLTNKVEMTY